MKCSQCGAVNQQDGNFCSYCSTPLPKPQQQQQSPQPNAPTVIIYNQVANTAAATATATAALPIPKRKNWFERMVWTVLAVCCGFMFLVGLIGFSANVNRKQPDTAGTTAGICIMVFFGVLTYAFWRKRK